MSDNQKTLLNDSVALFLLDCQSRRLSPKTLLFYRTELNPFLTWLSEQGVKYLQDLTAAHVRAWLVKLQDKGLRDTSQHAAARSIRAWCNFSVAEGLLDVSPMAKVKMPKLDRRILPALEQDDLARLLDACKTSCNPERDRAMILTLLDTGCRASEFVNLNIGDLDIQRGTLAIHAGKGSKDRMVFIGAKTRKAMLRVLMSRHNAKPNEPLWLSETTGERLTYYGLQMFLRRIGGAAGVDHCAAHSFRRTCALLMHRSGARLTEIAAILGHSDLTVLRKYLDLNSRDAELAHREHGPVDNLPDKKTR